MKPAMEWLPVHRAAAASPYDALAFEPAAAFAGQTIRQIVRPHRGGSGLRLHVSNRFGKDALAIGEIRVAVHLGGGEIDPSTDVAVTTDGKRRGEVPPGGTLQTDPAALRLPDDAELAVSMFITASGGPATYHHPALETSYVVAGNAAADARLRNAEPVTSLFWITGVDARVAEPGSAIAAFGDSLINGDGTTAGAGRRFPDQLARRAGQPVLNLGISGNRLLRDGFGQAGLSRFESDVLGIPGVTHAIIALGINDIGFAGLYNLPAPPAEDITGGLTSLARRARAAGLTPVGGTLPPCEGTTYPGFFSVAGEDTRAKVNEWIRGTAEFEAVIDIDAALRDPDRPAFLSPTFDSGDHLHPNDDGAQAMARIIDLRELTA